MRDTQLSSGRRADILHVFCHLIPYKTNSVVLGLNLFNKVACKSNKETAYCPRLGNLVSYLLSPSINDPASNEPSCLLKHFKFIKPSLCAVLCKQISWQISVHMVEAKPIIKNSTTNKRRAKESHGYHMPRHKHVKICVLFMYFFPQDQDRRQTCSIQSLSVPSVAKIWMVTVLSFNPDWETHKGYCWYND